MPDDLMRNSLAPFDLESTADLEKKVSEHLAKASEWMRREQLNTEGEAEIVAGLETELGAIAREVEQDRVATKKPFDDESTKVQKAYTRLADMVKSAKTKMRALKADYLRREEERVERERRDEAARLKEQQEKLEREARQAQDDNNITAQVDVEADLKAVEKAQKKVAKPRKVAVKPVQGGNRSGLRTEKRVTITSIPVLFNHYRDAPEVEEVLLRLAKRDVMAKDRQTPPGVTVTEVRV